MFAGQKTQINNSSNHQNFKIMPNNSETGHAVNVANFNDLISYVNGYGPAYNPTNSLIKSPALQKLATSATGSLAAVITAFPPYNAAVAAREVTFSPLSKLVSSQL